MVFLRSKNQFAYDFLSFLAIQIISLVAFRVLFFPKFVSVFRHLPNPPNSNLILGHGLAEFKMPRGEEYLRFIKETPNQGIIHLHGFLNSEQLLLTSPATLTEVLVHKAYDFEKPNGDRDFLRRILGRGLITAEGDIHKQQRRQVAPSFGVKYIRSLYPIFWEKSVLLAKGIASELAKTSSKTDGALRISGETDIGKWAQKVSLDIIGKAGFGWDFNTLRNPENELAASFEQIFAPSFENALLFALSVYGPKWILDFVPWGISERFLTATGNVRRVCSEFIQTKRAEDENEDIAKSPDILTQLIKLGDISEEMLIDQTLTFLTAGHETVSIALTWAMYLLAKHPEVQTSLRRELRDGLPAGGIEKIARLENLPSILESLPILNGVCSETIRLYPSAPVAVRVSTRDTSIMGQHVPKGTRLILAPWAVNRSPDIWGPTAEIFLPERWIDPTTNKPNTVGGTRSNYSLLTFLHGPRNCIGQGFARGELRALVAVLVCSFEANLSYPNEEIHPGGSLSAKPSGGMRMRLDIIDRDLV